MSESESTGVWAHANLFTNFYSEMLALVTLKMVPFFGMYEFFVRKSESIRTNFYVREMHALVKLKMVPFFLGFARVVFPNHLFETAVCV